MVKIVGICSAKGGVGKTTVTANLGASLTQLFNYRVVAIDCNFTTSHLGIILGLHSPINTLNDVLRGSNFEQATYVHGSGLKFVPSSIRLDDLISLDIDIKLLRKKIYKEFNDADFVLLDSAPGLGRESLVTIQISDEIIFVATPDIMTLVDIIKSKELIETLGKNIRGIVLNKVRGKKYELSDKEVEEITGLPVLQKIPENEKVLKSLNSGYLVVTRYPESNVSQSFFKLAAQLAGVEYKPRISIFKKFFYFFINR